MKQYYNFDPSQLSYYKTGGLCRTIFFPKTVEDVSQAIKAINGPCFILGFGSNSLVLDQEWEGAVLCLKEMNTLERISKKNIRVGAGALNSDVSEFALKESLGGLGWMYGLPGFFGATVRMNARCYGGEISQVVTKVITVDPSAVIKTYDNTPGQKDIFEAYKKTIFMDNGEVVAAVEVTLENSASDEIKNKMISCYQDRVSKGQYLKPSCGCVFKNNYHPEVSVPSGLLIDYCQLRGVKQGGAMVSLQHANFISNEDQAKSSDILKLSLKVREEVWEKTGVWLEYEMEVLGQLPSQLKERFLEKRKSQYNIPVLEKLREKFQSRTK